jgi:hypothetical protein
MSGSTLLGHFAPYLDAEYGYWWWIPPLAVLTIATAGR